MATSTGSVGTSVARVGVMAGPSSSSGLSTCTVCEKVWTFKTAMKWMHWEIMKTGAVSEGEFKHLSSQALSCSRVPLNASS